MAKMDNPSIVLTEQDIAFNGDKLTKPVTLPVVLIEDDNSHAVEVIKKNIELIEKLSKATFVIVSEIKRKDLLIPLSCSGIIMMYVYWPQKE
jgi:hypothetical protein